MAASIVLLLVVSLVVLQIVYQSGSLTDLFTISPTSSTPSAELVLSEGRAPAPKTFLQRCPEGIPSEPRRSKFKSQSGEDKEILRLFRREVQPLCGGTYLEMGALDGILFSNSYVFHRALNWTGVLVEASPRNYKSLVKNRPQEIDTVHSGVCGDETTLHWVESSRVAVGGFKEFAAPSFQERWWNEEMIRNAATVTCKPLHKVLHEATKKVVEEGGAFHFDFFSLDVEGAEYEVLRSNDWKRFTFGIVLVESDKHNVSKNKAVRSILEMNGYKFLKDYQRSQWFANVNWNDIYKDVMSS